MTIQRSVAARQAAGDSFETVLTAGGAPVLKLFSGALGANCAAADPTGLLGSATLPVDCFTAADTSVKNSKNNTWSGTGSAGGTAASYRLYANGGTVCHEQGTVTATGGGGDLTLDNTSIANGQVFTITSWDRTQGNP